MPMNSPHDNALISDCLGPLMMHLRRAEAAYKSYLAAGKIFRKAIVLWDCNTDLRNLLLHKGHLLPEALQADATAIVAHLDAWSSLFAEHREKDRPKPRDVFAFENEDRFPADAEAALKAHYRQIRGQRGPCD